MLLPDPECPTRAVIAPAFAKFRDEKELTREMLLALVEKIYVNEDKQVHIVLNYQDEMKKLFQEEV